MDLISIAAASGMRARSEALDLLGNNIANAATGGFKVDRELYNLHFGRALNVPGQPAALPVIEGNWTDFSQGLLQTTDNPLDLALDGEGFFVVQGPNGALYSRNGSFGLTSDGTVETSEGYPLLLEGGQPLRVSNEDPIEVSKDGTVRQSGRLFGKLQIVGFDDQRVLGKFGHTYFQAAGVTPGGARAEILQGQLEGSNVSTAESAVRIVGVLRQFEMLQKAISVANDMNQSVVRDVASVT